MSSKAESNPFVSFFFVSPEIHHLIAKLEEHEINSLQSRPPSNSHGIACGNSGQEVDCGVQEVAREPGNPCGKQKWEAQANL